MIPLTQRIGQELTQMVCRDSREKLQFSEIQKSKYPIVFLKDLKYTHKKILEQYQRDFRKKLRLKRPRNDSSCNEEESLYTPKQFKCSDCPYRTRRKESLDVHCANHKDNNLLKCNNCDFEANYKRDLVEHKLKCCSKEAEVNSNENSVTISSSKGIKYFSLSLSEIMLLIYYNRKSMDKNPSFPSASEPLKCSECNFETENQKCLEFHSQIHSEVMKCPECGYESTDTETFKYHLITHLCQSPSVSKTVADSFIKMSRHSNKTVTDELSDEDDIEMSEKRNSEFEDEMSDIKEDTLDSDQLESFKCLECSFETENVKIFNIHLQIHIEIKKCTECSFETKDVDTLKVHLINHFTQENIEEQKVRNSNDPDLNINKFICTDCSFETNYKDSFDAHCANHKNIKLSNCVDFNYDESDCKNYLTGPNFNSFPKKVGLNSNQNCNIGNQSRTSKFYPLTLSEIMFFIYNNMKSLGENIYASCPAEPSKYSVCHFEAENQKCLEFHSQIHSEVMKCPECGYESTDTDTFKDHLITHLDQFKSESESVPYSFRKRSKQLNKTVTDEPSDEEHSKITDKYESGGSDFEDEMLDIEEEETMNNEKLLKKKKLKIHEYAEPCSKKLYKCEDCDFKTSYKGALQIHKKRHISKCSTQTSLGKCFNIDNLNFQLLSLSEIINLICGEDKSLDLNTSDEATKEVLKCLECTFETGNMQFFNLHSQIHVEVKKCTECNFESKDSETFKDHLISHFKPENTKEMQVRESEAPEVNVKFICTDCSYKTNRKRSFDAHCAKHKNIKLFKCDHCDFETNYKFRFESHNLKCCSKEGELNSNEKYVSVNQLKSSKYISLSLSEIMLLIYDNRKSLDENASLLSSADPLKCSECSFETENQKCLEFHSQIHSEVLTCPECGYESMDKETFKDHLITHLDQSTSEKYYSLFLSEIMLLIFNNRKSLDENASVLSTSELLKCSECNFETENQKCLEFHSQIHSEVMKCPECSYESTDTETFRDHLITHLYQSTNEKYCTLFLSEIMLLIYNNRKSLDEKTSVPFLTDPLKCSECSFETQNQKCLEFHIQIHSKVLKCPECSHESTDKETFKDHLITHLDQSTRDKYYSLFLSEIMILIYKKRKSLNENASIPSLSEPLKCSECSFETENQKCLEFHSQIHCEVLKCPECSFENTNSETFKDHLITHLDQLRSGCESVQYSFRKRSSNKTVSDELSYEEQKLFDEEYSEMLDNDEEPDNLNTSFQRKIYTCDMCSFESGSYSTFISHLLVHNMKESDYSFITPLLAESRDYSLSEIMSMIYNDESESSHDLNLNSDAKLFNCAQCSFECHDEEQLLEHLSSHSSEIKFTCPQCTFEGSNESELDSHLATHSALNCSKCGYESSDVATLNLHFCEPNGDQVFKCSKCDFETKKGKHLTLHSQIHEKVLKCTECEYKTHRKFTFKGHLLTHLPAKLYSCSECQYKTNVIRYFRIHLLNHTGKRLFDCTKCDFKTNHRDSLKNHMETHLEFKSYRCSKCNFSTNRKNAFNVHLLIHSETKIFSCSECNYGCNSKSSMKKHLLRHSSQKLYKCSKCDFGTNQVKNMREHEARRHGGKYLHACSLCDFKCYKKSSFKKHSVIHSDTKLYKCPHCSYECHNNLKLHIQNMHSQTKIYKCSECKYEGNHRSNFLTHIRTHSSERKYKCSECSFSSKRKDNLKVHMLTHFRRKASEVMSDLENLMENNVLSDFDNLKI